MEVSLDFLLHWPLIRQKQTKNGVLYSGILEIKGHDCPVQLKHCKNSFQVKDCGAFNSLKTDLNGRLLGCQSDFEALTQVQTFLEGQITDNAVEVNTNVYQKVIGEYSEFVNFYMNLHSAKLAPDLSTISLSVLDEGQREHHQIITVDKDLYSLSVFEQCMSNKSLMLLFDQFLGVIEALQPYLNFMDHLDKNSWVLDKKHCYRRINLGDNTTVILEVDPYNIRQRPSFKFLGPERCVDAFRNRLNQNLGAWDVLQEPYEQILSLLGLDSFPVKSEGQDRGVQLLRDEGECSICFSFRLEGKTPEIVCQNVCCENCYHSGCLYEWLVSVNAKRVFNDIIGACPNCEKQISCPLPVDSL